jgi:hypothetical protein
MKTKQDSSPKVTRKVTTAQIINILLIFINDAKFQDA